jgi:hypothetical protein
LSGRDEVSESLGFQERVKARIDRFQIACWRKAGDHPGRRWGRLTLTEEIAGLLDSAGSTLSSVADSGWQPQRGQINPIDYFVCRCLRTPTIFFVRDGRACIRAKAAHQKLSIEIAVKRWQFSMYVLRRMAQFTEKLLIVRLEDLIRNPGEELSKVCDFLNIGLQDDMIASVQAAEVKAAFPFAEKASAEPWYEQISDDLRARGYVD